MKLKIASWTEDDFTSLPRGTYIRTTHGEGKVGDKLPTGSRVVKTVDKVERKLSYDDVTAIWDKSSKAWKKVEASMKLKKAYGNDLMISPRSLIQRALIIGVISPEEARSQAVRDAAQEQAEFVTDTWTEDEGIGSSDMNAFVYAMVQSAGFKVDWTSGRMVRKDKVAATNPENIRMMEFLAKHGIKCAVKYIWNGSLRGTWRLYGKDQKWTPELIRKLTDLRFKGFDGRELTEYSGNGGTFSVFVRGHNELLENETGIGESEVFLSAVNSELDSIMGSIDMNETQMAGRVASKVVAGLPRWHNVTSMRKDIEAMAEQIAGQLAEEIKTQQEDPGGMDFTRDFKRAQSLLDECSDKLRLLEGNI